jgi:beta-N-acetylhexosaminidase
MIQPGHFVMVDLPGTTLDANTTDFLRRNSIRAVCLFRRNLGSEAEIHALTASLRAVLGEHGLIAIDQEGGSVIRATSLPPAPSAMALGAIGDVATAHAVGAAVARGLAHLGINWNFAPVLDVNNNPDNPVIGARSFGADPERVAALARGWLLGSCEAGVACCVKHFPGHGDTTVDSHLALPRVDKPRAQLDALELLPFHALRDEAPAIMSAHIIYSALDANYPATLSRKILSGLLRDEWRYDGVVITDALNMRAIADHCDYGGQGCAGVLALQAGADMVMALGERDEQQAALNAIASAIANGDLPAEPLQRSQQRLESLAARFPLRQSGYLTAQRDADTNLMNDTWAHALTSVGHAVPPAPTFALRVIYSPSASGDGVSDPGVSEAQVRELFSGYPDVQFCPVTDFATLDWSALPDAQRHSVLVSTSRRRYDARARHWHPDLHIVMWNPFQALDVAAPALISWGFVEGARLAVRRWLGAEITAPGIAPVPLQPH